jgi:hypothetical protein
MDFNDLLVGVSLFGIKPSGQSRNVLGWRAMWR